MGEKLQMFKILDSLYTYRSFILGSVKREFQLRYQSSMFGSLWLFIQPLAMILVYTLVFSQVMRVKLPNYGNSFAYSIYLCSGSLTWAFFSETLNRSQSMFLDNSNLLKKIKFPRLCIPAIIALSTTINFLIIFSIFLLFLIFSNSFPGLLILAIIPLLLIQLIFSIGLGLVLGILNVFFRDIGLIFNIIMQFWFWFTPIVYPISIIPTWATKYLKLNPIAPLITSYQTIFTDQKMPDWSSLFITLAIGLIFLLIGVYLYNKHSNDLVDEL